MISIPLYVWPSCLPPRTKFSPDIPPRDHRPSCASFKHCARVFALRKYDFQIVSACSRRLRFHNISTGFFFFFIYTQPEVGTYYVFVFPVWFVRACLRISSNRPCSNYIRLYIQETKKQKDVVAHSNNRKPIGCPSRPNVLIYNTYNILL